jgi:hypothetical protein
MDAEIGEFTVILAADGTLGILWNEQRVPGHDRHLILIDPYDTGAGQRDEDDIDLAVHVRADTGAVRETH